MNGLTLNGLLLTFTVLAGIVLTGIVLTGCASQPQQYNRIPEHRPVIAQPVAQPVQEQRTVTNPTGSLYQMAYNAQMFSDRRAYRVGDILTIKLEEENKFSKDADTTMDKNGSITMNDPVLFGRTGASILGSGNSLAFNIEPSRQSYGSSNYNRNSKQEGSIAVQVVAVLPNGALQVRGEKWYQLNNEAELMHVSGILRPEDIDTNNEVSSKKLAQSKITYSGVGSEADLHEPGWLSKALNSPWFPF